MTIPKEKNASDIKKSLLKKNTHIVSCFSPKKKSHKNLLIKTKFGDSNFSHHKSNKNFSFFFKLKEKEKNPSKTPYLDTKFWKSSHEVTKFVNNDTNSKSPIKKRNSKESSLNKSQSPKKKNNNINGNDNNKEMFIKNEQENINDEDKGIKKKETKKIGNKDNIEENNNNCLKCKKKGKNVNNIIINILNKPFLCCLKSQFIVYNLC